MIGTVYEYVESTTQLVNTSTLATVLMATSGDGDALTGISTNGSGVRGESNTQSGVLGKSTHAVGVTGTTTDGVGMEATATAASGIALNVQGRLKAPTVSGVATIAKGATSVTVTPGVGVDAGSFVLLSPKVNLGGRDLWFTTNATADTFTIRMSGPRTTATKVAWLLVG